MPVGAFIVLMFDSIDFYWILLYDEEKYYGGAMEDNKLFHFNKKQVIYLIGSACCLIFGIVFSVLENGKGNLGELGNISAVIGTIICSNIFAKV